MLERFSKVKPVSPFFDTESYSKIIFNEEIFSLKDETIYAKSGIKMHYFAIDLDALKFILPKESIILPFKTIEVTKKI